MAIDVAQWLHGLGLGQYAATFARNDVDGLILLELTAEDLVSLGVSSVGHRRRLLSAIAALRDGPRAATSDVPQVGSGGEVERRQLTVMFQLPPKSSPCWLAYPSYLTPWSTFVGTQIGQYMYREQSSCQL